MKNNTLVLTIMFPIFIFSIIINCLILGPETQAGENIVAVVNGQKLSRNDLANLLIETFGKEGLDILIRRTLVRQEAKKLNVKVTKKDVTERINNIIEGEIRKQMKKGRLKDKEALKSELEKAGTTIEEYKKNILKTFKLTKNQIKAELLAEKIITKTIKITDEDLHEEYELQFGEKILARQIVLRSSREANKTLEKIKVGADFGALAKKVSVDRNSAARGGKMRPFGPHGILGKNVANLKEGEVSEVINTDSGYHILKIEKRIPKSDKKFSKVKDDLAKLVTAKKLQKRVGPWLLNIVETAKITNNFPE